MSDLIACTTITSADVSFSQLQVLRLLSICERTTLHLGRHVYLSRPDDLEARRFPIISIEVLLGRRLITWEQDLLRLSPHVRLS